jgi:hypothetical protein
VNAYEITQMNARIADRWAQANAYPTIPVRPPSWAATVIDANGELIAVHAQTGATYPVDLHADLDPADRAIVVGRRILSAGGTPEEVIRFLDAFELPHDRDRLVRWVREAT